MIVARFWIETFNYFQHYGQIRVKGTPIDRRHVWNHLRPLSRLSAFEITNHADHHLNSYTPYYTLTPHREAIPMPSVFVCFFAALIPQLWFKAIIQPALKRWDLQFASAAEKELAKAQNRRAGWPDWFESERRLAA
jgi:alkane 1-monooxygenase/p-cymene monooxygenase